MPIGQLATAPFCPHWRAASGISAEISGGDSIEWCVAVQYMSMVDMHARVLNVSPTVERDACVMHTPVFTTIVIQIVDAPKIQI